MAKLTILVPLLVVGLLGSALTVAAETDMAEWSGVNIPAEGRAGGWGLAPGSDLAHLSLAAGVLYADKREGATNRLMRSEDGGLSWAETDYEGGTVADIVCPRGDAETVYLTDGSHVYKSDDDGESFARVGDGTLPALDANETISCLGVGYNGSNHPIVFIGTADSDTGQYGGVYYLAEGDFGAGWTDMMAGGYDIYAIAASPNFDQDRRLIALASDESHSYIINNEGVIGGWSERIELLKDNTTSFVVTAASRICFPPDFDGIYELFVGATVAGNGDVYRVREDFARDLGVDADIVSLDLTGNSWLLAGGTGGRIWYSADDGESWVLSKKAPSGDGLTYVVMAPDFAQSSIGYAVTSGAESAFSISRDGGVSWNQTSLIDTEISDIVDLASSPDYSQDNTLFMLTFGSEHSLWRSPNGGVSWERVFCSGLPDVDRLERVALSPRYGGDNNVVLVAGVSNSSPSIWKSNDDGQSFSRRSTPLPVDAWAVVDDTSWFIGGFDGANGVVYRVTNSGLSYSEGAIAGDQSLNSIALSPDYSEDETLLVGNNDGWVYWSEDNGKSFQPLPPDAVSAPLSGELAVAFDPEYGSNGTVYAASNSAGEGIYRFTIGDSDWENIDSPVGGMMGQMVLSAEGALYSANYDADGGMERCLDPTFPLGPSFESVSRGLDEEAKLVGLWLHGQQLWSVDSENNKVMTYIDSLTAPVTLTSPLDGAPGVGMLIEDTAMNISLDWETLPGATDYQWQLNYETDFSSLPDGFEGTTQSSSVHLADLEPATTYYWRVKAIEPTLSPWSEKWSFTTSLGRTVTAPNLHSPEAGASGVSVSPIFQWSAIAGADSYELMVSTFATFDNPTILKTDGYALPTTAWQCNISLNHDTTYYWKVRAVSADSCSAWSAVSAFSTEPALSLPTGTVAEVPQPTTPQGSEWSEWLLPMGGVIMLVFLLTMIAMLITMIVLVIKVSKL
jgi:hypothetical protein